jgi:hypothetical protein
MDALLQRKAELILERAAGWAASQPEPVAGGVR